MKSLEEYLKLPYTIETRKESDGSYFIRVKELPGWLSVGDTVADAYSMIEDAKAAWIQSSLDDGSPIPEPDDGRWTVKIIGSDVFGWWSTINRVPISYLDS